MPARKKLDFRVDGNGCFILTSHRLNGEGYGYLYHNGKETRAHRFIYEICFGEIPVGLVVRHRCDNPSCINPEHLELGTQAQNMNDAKLRKRNAYGEKNGQAKNTEETARKIKLLLREGLDANEIMKITGVRRNAVRRIRENRSWKHVDL